MSENSELTRALPHDGFAERAILGAMLIENNYVDQVFEEISSEDFYSDSHKIIAAAIENLINNGSSADIVTVAGLLKKNNELNFVGGYQYLSSLLDGIPENINIEEYVKAVKDRSSLRKLMLTSMGVIKSGSEPRADTKDILNQLQEDLIKIADIQIPAGFTSAPEVVAETLERIESIQKHGESSGLKTDFFELDDITGGFQKGEFIVIAARPSMGKTALALNIAANMAIKDEKSVGFFSIEMSKHQVMMRMLSSRAGIDMSALMTGRKHLNQQEWRALELAASELGNAKIFIDDSASLSIVEMKTRARRLWREKGLDIVFVDYLQLMKVTGEQLRRNDSRAQEVAVISASLKELAKELQVPVVAMAQLSRAPEQRGTKRDGPKYQLSDLKESGAIEQDADVVMFLHREEQVDKDTERKGEADLIVAKQRNGPTGKIVLAFMNKFTKFASIDFRDKDYM
ncbi:MAG: replicative DNA helicase [Candidatus Aminicenantes bacterium]|nr:replicative DNA helicase [Candidatus Aminicenantes bacterium]NIM79423.1 replicative DNA helicase [Candidatus Aminicenantes bacterium]NIN18705.1 replicative DNA helicase [Candidatus Aminicenantes bacterium]NIN42629.1 replicative DNA helicase [Candidatus Aminicenantes bacterium]NIN85368.1 replicative DNA helicase [Candidatus Aminicenantes bacterium]